jgi:hypothetical protein
MKRARITTMVSTSAAAAFLSFACEGAPARNGWTGATDSLASTHIVVRNTADPIWHERERWRISEEWRIGRAVGDGPDVFGRIQSLQVDHAGRVWVLDGLAHRLVVFDGSGTHVMTTGREGGGPGEFTRPEHVEQGPDGSMWVVDVGANRISRFDATGRYLDSRSIPSGYPITPWRGGFDASGRFYTPVAAPPVESEQVAFTYVRHDSAFVPIDTLRRPHDPNVRQTFEFQGTVGRIPLQGSLVWQLTQEGNVLSLVTDEYRLIEFTGRGDTIRSITRLFTPLRVTEGDRVELRTAWEPYLNEGELPSWWSKLPATKPPVTGLFFQDDEDAIWVEREPGSPEVEERVFDVFDREGRYLGPVQLPYALARHPRPVVRGGFLYGVARDELDVAHAVKLRVIK